MTALKNIVFVDGATSPVVSEAFANSKGESIIIEVSGSAGSCLAQFQVCADIEAESENYTSIAGIDLSDLSVVTSLTKNGVYEFPIEGIQKFRINLLSSDGNIKIFARSIALGW